MHPLPQKYSNNSNKQVEPQRALLAIVTTLKRSASALMPAVIQRSAKTYS